ncbi:MAG: helix-turn-helix transcriptional regulator [Salibacteraceae bacterium]
MLHTRSPQPELFKKARKTLKCSQARLARLLGVHRSTISRIEKGLQCPNVDLLAGIERLTGKTAEAIAADAYCCKNTQKELAAEAVALPTDCFEYLHLKLHHQDALKKLRSRLRHKKRELATVKRCLSIDRSTVVALSDQIKGWQVIVNQLAKVPEVQQNATETLRQFQESYRKKDRMALIWAQRFTFEMEDEILLLQREIASRAQLLKAAEAKAEALSRHESATAEKNNVSTGAPMPSKKVLREETLRNTKAPPETEPPVSPMAPRQENSVVPANPTATGREPGSAERRNRRSSS